ncbi:bacteriocin immunity protein [Citrobacter freundii]|uniref:bacteriocin immunity protein n=1 Tax=Citrobacter freundii TaxID=546 RepID=UPI0038D17C34
MILSKNSKTTPKLNSYEFSTNPRYLGEIDREYYIDSLVDHFDKIVDHPEGNGLIFLSPR